MPKRCVNVSGTFLDPAGLWHLQVAATGLPSTSSDTL